MFSVRERAFGEFYPPPFGGVPLLYRGVQKSQAGQEADEAIDSGADPEREPDKYPEPLALS